MDHGDEHEPSLRADPVLETPTSRFQALLVDDPGERVGVEAGQERAGRVQVLAEQVFALLSMTESAFRVPKVPAHG